MLGWVAIGYGAGAAFALALACCGPSHMAKIVAAYLLVSWAISNKLGVEDLSLTMQGFSYLDFLGCAGLSLGLCISPSRWLFAVFLATLTQMGLHIAYLTGEQTDGYSNILANNLLFGFQVIMAVLPTFTAKRRRRRSAARRPSSSSTASTASPTAMIMAKQ